MSKLDEMRGLKRGLVRLGLPRWKKYLLRPAICNLSLVAAGMGWLLQKMVAEQRHHPGLRSLLLVKPKIELADRMTWRRGAYLPYAAKAWQMLVRERHGG
jgi:hypothetical protein